MRTLSVRIRACAGVAVVILLAHGDLGCSSTSSGGGGGSSSGSGSSGSSSGAEGGSGGSSGGSSGGCNADVYSYENQGNDCIESYAPSPPSGFTAGHCPMSGLNGCCKKNGPCGFTATCYYNLPSQLVSGAMNNCASMQGTWTATVP